MMARPSRGISEKTLQIRVPEKLLRDLKDKAKEIDKPVSAIIRDEVSRFIYAEQVDNSLQDIRNDE